MLNFYLNDLKEQIKRVTEETKDNTWNAEVELSWMFFMHHVYSREANILSFEELEKDANGSDEALAPTQLERTHNIPAVVGAQSVPGMHANGMPPSDAVSVLTTSTGLESGAAVI